MRAHLERLGLVISVEAFKKRPATTPSPEQRERMGTHTRGRGGVQSIQKSNHQMFGIMQASVAH